MALLTAKPSVLDYFASLGELASKIVHEADGIRHTHGEKWDALSAAQQEQLLDDYFIDESVRTFYATSTAVEHQKRASRPLSAGGQSVDGSVSKDDDLPTFEMLFPRPVRSIGKFVQGGVTDESETSKGTFTYVDEFAGEFSWETKSQLELWLPEGQTLPSPRSVRRGKKVDEVDRRSVLDQSFTENGQAPSVRAMAQALQRSTSKDASSGGRPVLPAPATANQGKNRPAPPSRSDSISTGSRPKAKPSPSTQPANSAATKPSPPMQSAHSAGSKPSPPIQSMASSANRPSPPMQPASSVTKPTGKPPAPPGASPRLPHAHDEKAENPSQAANKSSNTPDSSRKALTSTTSNTSSDTPDSSRKALTSTTSNTSSGSASSRSPVIPARRDSLNKVRPFLPSAMPPAGQPSPAPAPTSRSESVEAVRATSHKSQSTSSGGKEKDTPLSTGLSFDNNSFLSPLGSTSMMSSTAEGGAGDDKLKASAGFDFLSNW